MQLSAHYSVSTGLYVVACGKKNSERKMKCKQVDDRGNVTAVILKISYFDGKSMKSKWLRANIKFAFLI